MKRSKNTIGHCSNLRDMGQQLLASMHHRQLACVPAQSNGLALPASNLQVHPVTQQINAAQCSAAVCSLLA